MSKRRANRREIPPESVRGTIARIRRKYDWASPRQVKALVRQELEWFARQKKLRPLTLHELAARWYSYEKVIEAIASGKLRTRGDATFNWLHVLAVDIPIARMLSRPHPDMLGECGPHPRETLAAQFNRRLQEHRRESLGVVHERELEPGPTNIYFIEAVGTDLCKIGKSDQVSQRLRSLETMSAHPLKLLFSATAPPETERYLHRHFAEERRHGEWFSLTERLRTYIAKSKRARRLLELAA